MGDGNDSLSLEALFPPHELARNTPYPLTRHPAIVYLASLSEGSRRTIFQSLDTIAHYLSGGQLDVFALDWGALRYEHTAAVRAYLAVRYKASTANKMLSALRQVLHHAWKLGHMDAEDYHRARDIANLRGDTLPAGRDVAWGELSALLAACATDSSPAGARDAAIIALLYATGIRRASLVKLMMSDYDAAAQVLRVRDAKGAHDYQVYVTQHGAQRALADWLALRGSASGALFCPVNKGGRITLRALTTQAVYNVLVKRAAEAGVEHVSPHDLRRTLAGDLMDAGADIVTVQKILGHANVDTTARYDRRPEEVKRKAANMIHVPYTGRRQPALDDD